MQRMKDCGFQKSYSMIDISKSAHKFRFILLSDIKSVTSMKNDFLLFKCIKQHPLESARKIITIERKTLFT